jgi:hypothetical protein
MFSVRTHGADGANARRATTTIGLFTNPTAKVDAVVKSVATFFWAHLDFGRIGAFHHANASANDANAHAIADANADANASRGAHAHRLSRRSRQ